MAGQGTAVLLDNVSLTYGRGRSAVRALDGVTMSVPAGCVYGLLGPSGCGKTSILSCCLGIGRPDPPGTVLVFGRRPGTAGAGVPGPGIGYMPQTISLHSYFNAVEILRYYGIVFGVADLTDRTRELLDLIGMCDGKVEKRRIDKLSGGQKRRLSLACALIHKPRLLVLDEPTVGVDPVLRMKIWETLHNLTSQQGSTVIVTTHYMEEASMAHKIGFVRQGRMLREGSPSKLKADCGLDDLDDVFYHLCDEDAERRKDSDVTAGSGSADSRDLDTDDQEAPLIPGKPPKADAMNANSSFNCFRALCLKNLTVLKRHGLFMMFQAVMPVITFLIFINCVGRPVRNLGLAVFNAEGDCPSSSAVPTCPSVSDLGGILNGGSSLLGRQVSCLILDQLDSDVFAEVRHFNSTEAAEKSVLLGHSQAMLTFAEGFSSALSARMLASLASVRGAAFLTLETLSEGRAKVRLDTTDVTIAEAAALSLAESVRSSFLRHAAHCNLTDVARLLRRTEGLNYSLTVQELALREEVRETILSYDMLPAMMALILSMLAMALTSDLLCHEKELGMLTRDFACGISLTLSLVANLVCMLIVVAFQIGFSLILLAVIFPDLTAGLLVTLTAMFFIQALLGMTLGFLLTALLPTTDQVIQAGISLIFPVFLLSGVLWPRVAMPAWLRWVAVVLPNTIACDVTRAIVLNRSTDVPMLYVGFLMPVMYAMIFFGVCLVVIRTWGFKV